MNNFSYGKIAFIDLSSKKVSLKKLDSRIYKMFLGGSGLGSYFIFKDIYSCIDPYSPENKLVFSLGPYHGTAIPGGIKWSVISRSPLTGTIVDSAAGSSWGLKLKKCGFDALIIFGISEKPTYLFIEENKITFEAANDLWGNNTFVTTEKLAEKYRLLKPSVACIGLAGENKVAIANIVVDKNSFAGRCGLGAVMGSKKLKAIVINGKVNKKLNFADKDRVVDLEKILQNRIRKTDYAKAMRIHGRSLAVKPYEKMGNLPVKYWTEDSWEEGAKKIGAPAFTNELNAKGLSCIYCPIACHRKVEINFKGKLMKISGPEYETLGMFGPCLDIDNVKDIAYANHLCNLFGIDSISLGAYVGFIIRCFEEGIINKNEYPHLKFEWGNKNLLFKMIRLISETKSIGKIFQDGIVKASQELGGKAIKIAAHVKGLDVPSYDPRAFYSMAINYATGNRGACHVRGFAMACAEGFLLPEIGIDKPCDRFSMKGKAFITKAYQDYCTLCNSIGLCNTMLIAGMTLTDIQNCFNAITGWDFSISDLMECGDRIFTLQRMVNNHFGFNKKDDALPEIFFKPAKTGGRAGKIPEPFEETLMEYYKLRGWDEQGIVLESKIKELALNNI